MATRTYTVTDISGDGSVLLFSWTGLLNGDDGAPIEWSQWADRSVHFAGTFGTGGTIAFEGSNDGSTYSTLNDPTGTPISRTSAGIRAVMEITRLARPRVTAGDAATNLSCHVVARRATPMRT